MYIAIKNIINQQKPIRSTGRIKILEFFPSVRTTPRGIMLPLSKRTNNISEVFRTFATANSIQKTEVSSGVATPLDFDNWYNMLNQFIDILRGKDRELIISTAPVNQMYETYKHSLQNFFVAGVVCIVDDSLGNPVPEISFIPNEGEYVALGFSTYTSICRRMFPKLEINISTMTAAYKNYLSRIGAKVENTVEIPFLINITDNRAITRLIDELTSSITLDDIRDIVNGGHDYRLERYYQIMSTKFGLRDTLSRSLLVYRSGLVNEYIEQAQNMSQIFDLRQTYYEDREYNSSNLSDESLFGETSMFAIR